MVLKVDLAFFTFYTNAQDFNAFFYFFLITTMMEKRSNLTAELKKLNWILDSLNVLKTI